MSDTPKAVFISYAREDIAAAQRIADALGAFEVEVWFDQTELQGGDAWDQKIRRQIRECALFVPIVSARTEARREAYFRLEWKLAEERTHLMAEGTSFLLPIAVDGTSETAALVPESFRRAQWMRLPRGVPNTQFVDRVRTLLESQQQSPAASAGTRGVSRRKLPGKKWALVAAIVALGVAASIPFWSKRDAVPPAAGLAPAVLVEKSIAVLPFTNMSDDKENGFFTDGIHEDILTNLANIADLKVIARTSVMQYRDTKKTIRQIGGELGVAFVLEGSVRRAGNTVRVTGQLIDVRTEGHVWANRYDREFELKDLFTTQSVLANQIVAALHAVLTPQDKALLARAPTDNPAAYDLYLQGREALRRSTSTRERLAKSEPLLNAAVKLDPGFVRAWRTLATVHNRAYNTLDRTPARLAQAKACIDTALRLSPDDPDVILGLGNYHEITGDRAKATEIYQRVVRMYPNNIDALTSLGSIRRSEGHWDEFLATVRRTRTLDPQSPEQGWRLYQALSGLRRYDEMEKLEREDSSLAQRSVLQRFETAKLPFLIHGTPDAVDTFVASLASLRRSEPDALIVSAQWAFDRGDAAGLIRLWEEAGPNWRFSPVLERYELLSVAMAFMKLGQPERAKPLLEKNRAQLEAELIAQPTNEVKQMDLALTHAMLADKTRAREFLARAEKLGLMDRLWGVDHATIHAWLGQNEQAIGVLAASYRRPGNPTYGNVHAVRHALGFWPLQGDPRFEAILNDPKNNAPLP